MAFTRYYGVPGFSEFVAVQVTATTSGAALGTVGAVGYAWLQADPGNSGTVSVGDASSQPWALAAGDTLPGPLTVDDLAKVWVKGSATGQKVNLLVHR